MSKHLSLVGFVVNLHENLDNSYIKKIIILSQAFCADVQDVKKLAY